MGHTSSDFACKAITGRKAAAITADFGEDVGVLTRTDSGVLQTESVTVAVFRDGPFGPETSAFSRETPDSGRRATLTPFETPVRSEYSN